MNLCEGCVVYFLRKGRCIFSEGGVCMWVCAMYSMESGGAQIQETGGIHEK